MLSKIIAMVICVILSAYFSATETAFSSVNKTRLKVLAENGNRKAALAHSLAEDYDRLISTILVGNNVVNIALASIGTLFFVDLLGGNGNLWKLVTSVLVVILNYIGSKLLVFRKK